MSHLKLVRCEYCRSLENLNKIEFNQAIVCDECVEGVIAEIENKITQLEGGEKIPNEA